jgi:protein-disulfide isomerase
VKEYDGKVRVVFKNMVVHPQQVMTAHLAACAAGRQGKFLPFYKAFWDKGFNAARGGNMAALGLDNILVIAKGLGLDTAKLQADINGPECRERIQKDMQEMEKFHVNATPGFFINGKQIIGGLPKEAFKSIIDEQLATAEASGVPAKDYYDQVIMAKGEKKFRAKKDPKPN